MTITTWPARWPASAKDVADGITRLSAALRDEDADARSAAVSELASQKGVRVEDVYAAMLRLLLEAAHPDGLDGDDVGAVVRDAASRDPDVSPSDVVTVVLGTLGVHPEPERQASDDDSQDPEDHRESQTVIARLASASAIRASAVVTEALLSRVGSPVEAVVTMVIDDIAAAETIEWP